MAMGTEDTISHIMMVAIVTAIVAPVALLATVMAVADGGVTLGMDMAVTAVGVTMDGVMDGATMVGVDIGVTKITRRLLIVY
jgi:hypothetical protein